MISCQEEVEAPMGGMPSAEESRELCSPSQQPVVG